MRSELRHAVLLAMDEKGSLRASLPLPVQQFCLIGMGRKPVNRVDTGPDGNVFSENSYLLGAIDNPTCKRTAGGVAHEHDS